MWILLLKKLPTKPSPPKLSMFWSEAWPITNHVESQKERYLDPSTGKWLDWTGIELDEAPDVFYDQFGLNESNVSKARKITYMGHDLRVMAEEYKFISNQAMRDFIFGISGEHCHELVENDHASKMMLQIAKDTDLRTLYEHALLDGCSPEMANMVAMGMDVSDDMIEFPPVGYYRPIYAYASVFCHDWELEETPPLKYEDAFNGR